MNKKKVYSLILFHDFDIEIRDTEGEVVYHKTYNPGESLRHNLFDALVFFLTYDLVN